MTGLLVFAANTLAWTAIIGGYAAFAWEMSHEPAVLVWEVDQ